ncbi:hypothetical protein [uncultured Litoreibacter sp.]|uniref:hypothetical protein n=1 Tax=uncultured Litoreibacter sp. TaxID=1392394 RepID=UPI0026043874|nr:hypothetical protein [uncultured Litoreibacter sp.]
MSWFRDLTGLSSDGHAEVWDVFDVDGPELVSRHDGRRLHFGTLTTPSLSDLRARTAGLLDRGKPIGASQIVADAAALHRDAAHAGALFQVASQFNLLEMISPEATPEDGITGYAHDHTQGPVCAIACGAGTLFRNYFLPFGPHRGQLIYRQLDMASDLEAALGDVGSYWRMENGYLLPHSEAALHEVNTKLMPDMDGLLRIGLQGDTSVTGTDIRVTQAYCSAVPVSYSGLSPTLWKPLGCMVLNAAYEATLHAAILNAEATGNDRVFLTLLGGGAFGNPKEWITDAIEAALRCFSRSGLDVRVVSYGAPDSALDAMIQRAL